MSYRKVVKNCGDVMLYQRCYEDITQAITNVYDLEGPLFDQMAVWCVVCALQFSVQDGKHCIISFHQHSQDEVRHFLRFFEEFNLEWRFITCKANKHDVLVNFRTCGRRNSTGCTVWLEY